MSSQPSPEKCKGLFFRCRVTDHSTRENRDSVVCPTTLHRGASYRLLLKLSCQDDNCGQCIQFYEDLDNTNMENFFWPEAPVDGLIYEAKFNLSGLVHEELYAEWEWVMTLTDKEIRA